MKEVRQFNLDSARSANRTDKFVSENVAISDFDRATQQNFEGGEQEDNAQAEANAISGSSHQSMEFNRTDEHSND